jgi:hypothetical protein
MDIEIKYKLIDNENVEQFKLTPEVYFDSLDENENFEEDGIPRYQHTLDYLTEFDNSIPTEKIEFTLIEIRNSIKSDHKIKTNYFGQGQSDVIYRKDKDGYELIIQSIKVTTNSILISRMQRKDSDSEWEISSSIGVNYEAENTEKENWYSVTEGEFVNQTLKNNE